MEMCKKRNSLAMSLFIACAQGFTRVTHDPVEVRHITGRPLDFTEQVLAPLPIEYSMYYSHGPECRPHLTTVTPHNESVAGLTHMSLEIKFFGS